MKSIEESYTTDTVELFTERKRQYGAIDEILCTILQLLEMEQEGKTQ